MQSVSSDKLVVERALLLKDQSQFIVIEDSFTQSAQNLVDEILSRAASNIVKKVFLSFETVQQPEYISTEDLFIDCLAKNGDTDHGLEAILESVIGLVKAAKSTQKKADNELTIAETFSQSVSQDPSKTVMIIDSLNYLLSLAISKYLGRLTLIHPGFTILATYHTSLPDFHRKEGLYYPSKVNLIRRIASSVYEVGLYHDKKTIKQLSMASHGEIDEAYFEDEHLENQFYNRFVVPMGLNNRVYNVKLTKLKKSGKKMEFFFRIDPNGEVQLFDPHASETVVEDESLVQDLSTFNLTTSDKQKRAKNEVELPFLDAQNFENGGAIVYQFEKDDDYDEDDPYEDPF